MQVLVRADDYADLQATVRRQGDTIALLADTLLVLFPEHTQVVGGLATAAWPLRDVIERAAELLHVEATAYDYGEAADAAHTALQDALEHPLVAGLLAEWGCV